jgi:hypothetical protein
VVVRVLLFEAVETDAELAMRRLRQDGRECTWGRVLRRGAAALEVLLIPER